MEDWELIIMAKAAGVLALVFGLVVIGSPDERRFFRKYPAGVAVVAFFAIIVLSWLFVQILPRGPVIHYTKKSLARAEARQIVFAIGVCREDAGVKPTGGSAQILKMITGDNPHKIVYVSPDIFNFNAEAGWLDPWGTPYRIGISPSGFAWAYSCGPNKIDEGGAPGSDDITSW